MAGVLTGPLSTTRTLIRLRMALLRNAPSGGATLATGLTIGTLFSLGTLPLGLIPFDAGRTVDLLAAVVLTWLVGWVIGPIAFRGGGQGLRPEHFVLLPLPPRRLAVGLLGASFFGFAPLLTLIALSVMVVAGIRLGPAAALAAVPATLLILVVIVLVSKVVVAAMAATLDSRRGQDLGGLLTAMLIALSSGGWSLASAVGQQLATGPAPALSTALRVLPSGWGPVAVGAAGQGDWAVAAGALAALAALAVALLLLWAALLERTMVRSGGQAPRVARTSTAGTGRWRRVLHRRGPTGAVVVRELLTWRRDSGRSLLLVLALMIGILNVWVPALVFRAPSMLPFVGLATAAVASMGSVNLYGADGTSFWLTRMVPGSERADVRGRQFAWLLVVAPVTVVLSLALTVASGRSWTWPWLLAALPAVVGGTAGLMLLVSVFLPVQQKDPHKRSGPFDTGDDPNATGSMVGQGYLMLGLVLVAAAPGIALVLAGSRSGRPALSWAGVAVGLAVGVALAVSGARISARRLATRGAELMDLLHLGPEKPAAAGTAQLPARLGAARNALWLVGILCIFPQGLVPIVFSIIGVDQSVRVWFAARYLPGGLQVPVALGFIAIGGLCIWSAEAINRRFTHNFTRNKADDPAP